MQIRRRRTGIPAATRHPVAQYGPYGLPDCLRMSLGDAEEMEITAAAFKDLGVHLSGRLPGRGNGSTS